MVQSAPQYVRRAVSTPSCLLLLLALAACGGEPPPAPPAPQRWNVPPATAMEQARFALDRLLTGPVPQDVLRLPEQHVHVLRTAKRDLAALPRETLTLLADPALVERLTGPEARATNPWHNVLELMTTLPKPEVGLVRMWVEPTLQRDEPSLWLLAAGNLRHAMAPELAPFALALLERGAHDRQVASEALRALALLPPPWPERALEVVLRRGSPFAWLALADAMVAGAERDPTSSAPWDALAWWALLSEVSAPRPSAALPRVKTLPWTEGPALAPRGPLQVGTWLPPVERHDDRGWFATDLSATAEMPLFALMSSGQEPAAHARCALARAGRRPALHSIAADRQGLDPMRRRQAQHCMLTGELGEGIDALVARTEAFLAGLGQPREAPWTLAEVREIASSLPPAESPREVALLRRVVFEARPLADVGVVAEAAHDRLRSAGRGEDEAIVLELLATDDVEARGLATTLARQARKGRYIAPLLEREAKADPAERRGLRQALHWIAVGNDVSPETLAVFVQRYETWVAEASDDLAGLLAAGLLDLGTPGRAAFVRGLKGPRGPLYVRALADMQQVLPRAVAEAIADSVDERLAPESRRQALVILWRGAPAEAAGAIAAAKARLDPSERPAVDVVLQTVRHRASRAPGDL